LAGRLLDRVVDAAAIPGMQDRATNTRSAWLMPANGILKLLVKASSAR